MKRKTDHADVVVRMATPQVEPGDDAQLFVLLFRAAFFEAAQLASDKLEALLRRRKILFVEPVTCSMVDDEGKPVQDPVCKLTEVRH